MTAASSSSVSASPGPSVRDPRPSRRGLSAAPQDDAEGGSHERRHAEEAQGAVSKHAQRLKLPGYVRLILAPLAAGAALFLSGAPARADLRMCNITDSRIGVSIGYRDANGWVTEGWWNLGARACDTLLRGDLSARYFYLYAVDYDRGGEWSGRSYMCTREREFSIRGVEDCLARGFDRSGFVEIDTGEQKSWTVELSDPGRTGPPPRTP